jgi:manganese/zinc/iron transport system permease protein
MGVVFTSLFALGVVLVSRYTTGVHFDVACVYEGALQFVALDTVDIAGRSVPRTLLTIGPVVLLNGALICLLWKELKLSAFDAGLATAMGFSATLLHYLLMAMVAVTTVASFEAVGSILVVAMLIVPAATAHLLCDRLGRMLLVACVFAVLASVVGFWAASTWNVNPAGAMTVVAGGFYGFVVLLSPRYGILSTLARNLQTSLRIVREDILSMLFRVEELGAEENLATADARAAVGGGMLARWSVASLVRGGNVVRQGGQLHLTDTGRHAARQLVRSHRLWEAYLVQHLGLPLDHVHEPAHRVEHFIDEKIQRELEQAVEDAATDPHAREIPE